MSVTNPIEHLAMAPKSLTASIHNVTKLQKEEMVQAQTVEGFKEQTKKSSEHTVKSQKSEYKEYRYDRKDESKQQGHGSKKKSKQQEDVIDEDDVAAKLGRTFDVRI